MMIVYMVRDKVTGLWYKRGYRHSTCWVQQNKASIWPNNNGPNGAIREIKKRINKKLPLSKQSNIADPEIIILEVSKYNSDFGLTSAQYHAGLDKLWFALGLSSAQNKDIFTLAAERIRENDKS